MPSPTRDGKTVDRATEETGVLTPEVEEVESQGLQDTQPATWYDRVQERLGDSGSGRARGGSGSYNDLVAESGGHIGKAALPGNDGSPARTLARMATQTEAIADSVNIIDHQFKLQVLGRLGRLEDQLRELEENYGRTRDAVKGIESKLQWRKGVPCDMLERLDSMSSFTYAFCKSMEDAGVFQMRKK